MAEKKNEETTDEAVAGAPEAEAPSEATDANASEAASSSDESATAAAAEAPAEAASDADATSDGVADEAPAEAAAGEEPVAEEAAAPVAEEAAAPAEVVAPKERRRRARAEKAAQIPERPARTPEERQADRVAERARKAKLRSVRRKQEREKARAQRGTTETPEPLAARREQHPGKQKTRQGIVVSDRATKTIVVRVDVARRHRRYEKIVRTSNTLHAHDEREDANIGDTVIVRESRPLSRTKHWRLVEVLERAK
jgi:small subunit ribosomal protein S17